jgi:ribosome recycling factor
MSVDQVMQGAVQNFDKVIEHLKQEFVKLQVGRANPAMFEGLMVDVYGSMQPIKAIASISVPEPRSLAIQPWDKGNLMHIEKAIANSGFGLNPLNDGVLLRINIPPLTEERRSDLAKIVKKLAEDARIALRNARHDAHNKFKQMKGDGDLTEDDVRGAEKKLQDKVDQFNSSIDSLAKGKENDVMTV